MARLFGTDGIRGVANQDLSCELAMKIGMASASVLNVENEDNIALIGTDTRISKDMLSDSLKAGLMAVGMNVIDLGTIPTPAVAYLVKKYGFRAGFVVSASHNPYYYNGIKIFGNNGFKIADELEEKIEDYILNDGIRLSNKPGKLILSNNLHKEYIHHLRSSIADDLTGLKVGIDCGHGAACLTAHKTFVKLGSDNLFINDQPNGENINHYCGSTDLKMIKEAVINNHLDVGVAFDGDADRSLFVDEHGNEVDGDFVLAICADYFKKQNKLTNNTVVGTVMSNMGLKEFCHKHDIDFIPTKVGDRYVLEEMELGDYALGGEQSGHTIFKEHATTGDGQITAIQLLNIMKQTGESLSSLCQVMEKYPQVLENIQVSPEGKINFYRDREIQNMIEDIKRKIGDNGRLLVRLSGTEPVIRVMAEGKNISEINNYVLKLSHKIKSNLK